MLNYLSNNPSWIIFYLLVRFLIFSNVFVYFSILFKTHQLVFPHAENIKHLLRLSMVEKIVDTNDIVIAIKNISMESTIAKLLHHADSNGIPYNKISDALNCYTENKYFSWDSQDRSLLLHTPNGTIAFQHPE